MERFLEVFRDTILTNTIYFSEMKIIGLRLILTLINSFTHNYDFDSLNLILVAS